MKHRMAPSVESEYSGRRRGVALANYWGAGHLGQRFRQLYRCTNEGCGFTIYWHTGDVSNFTGCQGQQPQCDLVAAPGD